MARRVTELRHGRVSLALHTLSPGVGTALLLLHGLGGSAADWTHVPIAWPGPVYGLDLCGHGGSDRVVGGAYTPELVAGDADAALAKIGPACIAGAGLGAWVALLVAGARPEQVPATLLLPGPGLAGGGALPDFEAPVRAEWIERTDIRRPASAERASSDPFLIQLESDVRPLDYAGAFAARARRLLLAEDGGVRPPWWQEVAKSAAAERVAGDDRELAFQRLASSV